MTGRGSDSPSHPRGANLDPADRGFLIGNQSLTPFCASRNLSSAARCGPQFANRHLELDIVPPALPPLALYGPSFTIRHSVLGIVLPPSSVCAPLHSVRSPWSLPAVGPELLAVGSVLLSLSLDHLTSRPLDHFLWCRPPASSPAQLRGLRLLLPPTVYQSEMHEDRHQESREPIRQDCLSLGGRIEAWETNQTGTDRTDYIAGGIDRKPFIEASP
jgi:hypothetical protein